MQISSSTIAKNQNGFRDQPAAVVNRGLMETHDSTIIGNRAYSGHAGVENEGGCLLIQNSIIAANVVFGFGTVPYDLSRDVISGGHNLIGARADGIGLTHGANGDLVGTTNAPMDALTGPLQDNGGPTPTCLPVPGSPALNAGTNAYSRLLNGCAGGSTPGTSPSTDQRGHPRVKGAASLRGSLTQLPPGFRLTTREMTAARKRPIAVAKEGDQLSGSPFTRCFTDGTRNSTPPSASRMVTSLAFMHFIALVVVQCRLTSK
jgi:hypothetical protein